MALTNYSMNVGDVYDVVDQHGTAILANGVTTFSTSNPAVVGAGSTIGTQPFTVQALAAGTSDVDINGVTHTITVSDPFDWQLGTKQN